MTDHSTPRPWRMGDMFHTVFGPPNGNPAPVMVAQRINNRDNARLIVRAVNSYDAMREALQGFLDVGMSVRHDSIIWEEARAALALAEKGE